MYCTGCGIELTGAFCTDCGQQAGNQPGGQAAPQVAASMSAPGFRISRKIWLKLIYLGIVILGFKFVTGRLSNLFPQ